MISLNKPDYFSNRYFYPLVFVTFILGIGLGYFSSISAPILIIGGLLLGIMAIFIFKQPIIGIFLIAFFLPFERIGAYELGELTIRISQVLAIVTVLGWFFYQLFNSSFYFKKNPLNLPLTIFLLVNVVSLINAENLERSVSVLIYTIFTVIFGLLVPQLVTRKEQIDKIVKIIIISAFIVGAFGIFQFLGDTVGLPQSITGLRDLYTKEVLGFPRIQSTALEPLYFANYLLIPLGLLCALFLSKDLRFKHYQLALLLVLLGINLVLTVSRGGYLAFTALLVIVGIFYFRSLLTPKKIIIGITAIILIFFVATRFLGLGDSLNLEIFRGHVVNVFYGAAYSERVETLQTALAGFHLHPWVGIGVGGFGPFAAVHPYVPPPEGWRIVNNEFIELLSEVGLWGLLSFSVVILIIIFRSLKAIQIGQDKNLKAVMIGLLAAFVGVLVQYLTFSVLYIMHVWFLIGLMISVQNIIFEKE
ncbi:MAG: hypothetical protein COY66_04795 [Candidatus Kerfeldbacteria bacterium CG_4_10_14_0_8_um_filter_42_10]|uniref:O-antigen ligase-related domain-containing protein n=1 Tax=Candidatus Kerfeldbacteria bacterium CG_4_10_14_0_8_um_filter_42_10 TaxID=2014248 RepID=A0A2M7RHF1_9BACT|nr:MAG: hypothetical protein COY66_04795 [Candidatus Kerfeldbacteria bacterium CG_4_10_14_0_8_um_filter_42_10]